MGRQTDQPRHSSIGATLLSAAAVMASIAMCTAARAEPVARPDVPLLDMSRNDYGPWTAEGDAFRPGPAAGEMITKLEIENAPPSGGVASSEMAGDKPVGTLTSPEFTIERRYVAFTIAGGDYERHTCLDLLIDGQTVRSATGWRSDRLEPHSWDVSPFAGKRARIRMIDGATGDWGHINVGSVIQTDSPINPPPAVGPLYHEALRPQFHFTARQWTMNLLNPRERQEGWLNDLNGLIYYQGEYHLFAQRWNKCWVHAVSRDLLHWTELAPAFWEEELNSGVQSGTCVIDYQNTSGLARDADHPAMVAFYSRNDNKSQCMAYSLDAGRTWTQYKQNPVLEFPERDPQVFWHAPTKRWVMMLYGSGQYHVFTSTNLRIWTDQKKPVPDSFECPDLFEISVAGEADTRKWVLIQGSGKYSIGTFDGTQFNEESGRFNCDYGDFYATQSWHNTETGDGRRIQCAWMRFSHFPDMPFSQQVTFPCELTLRKTPGGLRIFRAPVREIEQLHGSEESWTGRQLSAGQTLRLTPAGRQFHLKAQVEISPQAKLVFNIRGQQVTMSAEQLMVDQRTAPVQGKIQSIEMLIDTTSVETFLNDGETSFAKFFIPGESGISLRAQDGTVTIKSLSLFPLKSAWPEGTDHTP